MAHDFKDATRLLPEFGMTDTGQGWHNRAVLEAAKYAALDV